jgi:hypothetical protein
LLAHESQLRSTMGIDDDASTEVAEFGDRVLQQLEAHGALAGIALGESFHLITEI